MLTTIHQGWRARQFRKQREIFRFYDGQRWRNIDPWRTWKEFISDPHYNYQTMAELAAEQQEPEYGYALQAICRAFGVAQLDADGNGMTDIELLAMFGDFVAYLDRIKKKFDPGLTSSEPMGGLLSPSPADRASTTNSPLPSPCSTDEHASAPRESSPTES